MSRFEQALAEQPEIEAAEADERVDELRNKLDAYDQACARGTDAEISTAALALAAAARQVTTFVGT
jgi:hypothetical protein